MYTESKADLSRFQLMISVAIYLLYSTFAAEVFAQTVFPFGGKNVAQEHDVLRDRQAPSNSPQTRVPGQDEDVIRINTDVTNLLFTATDMQNHFITTLQEQDIRVLEDGVPQKFLIFQRETDRLLSIALMIDVSASEERTLPAEKAAVRGFVQTVVRSRKDEAALVPFTGDAFLEQPLTGNVTMLYQALERVDVALPSYYGSGKKISGIASGPGMTVPAEGSTAIWDSVVLTAGAVLARSADKRRRAIILLTDGQDTSSRLKKSEAIDEAIKSETVIYAIGIGDSKHFGGVDKKALRTLAEATGGRAFFPNKPTDLDAAFEQIEQELRSQYLVVYSSTNKKRDGTYRQLRIEITNPSLAKEKLKLTYRPGYFAKEPSASRNSTTH